MTSLSVSARKRPRHAHCGGRARDPRKILAYAEVLPAGQGSRAAKAREELGLNPEDLGSPWGVAIFSFLSFAAGALVPLLPFMALSGERALPVSIVFTALTLFTVGAVISLFTGRSALRDGLRMLTIGATAGALTYTIGKLLGVSLTLDFACAPDSG